MAGSTKENKSPTAGKKSSPSSQARVERKKSGAKKPGTVSQPKQGKGTEGTGGKGGGLH
jgi:hypothetical protein